MRKTWKDTTSGIQSRGREQIEVFLEGFDVLAPGLVFVPEWRPEQSTEGTTRWIYGAVARRT